MKNLTSLLPVISIMLFSCSSSLKVYTTNEKDVDFKSYKTFDFYEIKEEHLKMKEVNRRRLAMAIELELGYKGIKRSVNDPDLLVNLYSLISRTENINTNTSSVGYYGAATPYGTGIGISVSPQGKFSEYYTKGTVTIDLVDRVQNRLVLEGVAKIDAGSGDDADRIINYTVKKVFKKIPDASKRR
ncbi:MAG: DUF4136 domain-containing protein [Cytophagales bacterium]|nr:DUF4136 domain-containing protein [Cytophagales bacterium]